ncbi:MAG: acyltransferase family protein [Firmicutes bacterium]|nr:acyltransferase family protein [Candidatus Colimorpha enterica]
MAYCAVDGFALISGYVAVDKPRKYERLVEMWFQVVFYSLVVTVVMTLFGLSDRLSVIDIIKCILPVTAGKFWYFTAFFCLYFAIPVLNRFLFSVDEVMAKKALIIFAVLFSLMETLNGPFKTNSGYSALWLIALYCIGVLAKRIKLFEKKSNLFLIISWLLCVIVSWAVKMYLGTGRLISYTSPTILLCGMIMVILFSRIKIKGTVIKSVSPLAFGIYLFQLNQVIWGKVLGGRFSFVADEPLYIGVVLVFAFSLCIFLAGLAVEFVRSKLANLLRIPLLSKKIVSLFDWTMSKLFFIMN